MGKSIGHNSEESSNLDMFSLEMFENIEFVMAKHADVSIPNTPNDNSLILVKVRAVRLGDGRFGTAVYRPYQ